jgi:hypothetical protein
MKRTLVPTRALCALLAMLAACQDVPTIPTHAAPPSPYAANSGVAGLHFEELRVACPSMWRAPAPASDWRKQRDTLSFPRAELDRDGRTVRYRYRRTTTTGDLEAVGECLAPYSASALRRMDRHFGVKRGGGAEQFAVRQGTVTTQGCVTDGMCELEPIIVEAPPMETPEVDACDFDPATCGDGTGGSRIGGSSGGNPSMCQYRTVHESGTCQDILAAEEEADAFSCPANLVGKVITALIAVAGRNHEFRFDGKIGAPMRRIGRAQSPANYRIAHPTVSEHSWWVAESGTVLVRCTGVHTPPTMEYSIWLGVASYAGRSDLHMVMGPGHPEF